MPFLLEFKSLNQIIDAEDRAMSPSDTTGSVYKVFLTGLVSTNEFIYEFQRKKQQFTQQAQRAGTWCDAHRMWDNTTRCHLCMRRPGKIADYLPFPHLGFPVLDNEVIKRGKA